MPTPLTVDQIRSRWIEFFVSKGHKHIGSDSLVPKNDPSVLFTGAGMNQFKDHFMGRAKLEHPAQRATTVQKCIRTGDIGNVGRTPSHHTFFEMLGNFSFGDYFKKEAVAWAWEFLTDTEKGLGIEKNRLSVTIFGGDPALGLDRDTEAEGYWKHNAPELQNADGSWRIYGYGEHDNFWPADAPSQGPNGPCGPCSEIYFDTKPEQGTPEPVADSKDATRYVEIWNLVFTQFNRTGGQGVPGKLEPLGMCNIDTGSGLERVARVLQRKSNNYETDLIFPIVQEAGKIAGKTYGQDKEDDRRMRRIADHARSALFCIGDGVAPKNEGRNYVVRRLVRRAILDGRELGIREAFLARVAQVAAAQMSVGYPEMKNAANIIRIIEEEERAFTRTLNDGSLILDGQIKLLAWREALERKQGLTATLLPLFTKEAPFFGVKIQEKTDGLLDMTMALGSAQIEGKLRFAVEFDSGANAEWEANKGKLKAQGTALTLNGGAAFVLWDTFGFPLELTEEVCNELGVGVDVAEYEKRMDAARRLSQAGSAMAKEIFAGGPVAELKKKFAGTSTKFLGYSSLRSEAKVLAIIQENKLTEKAHAGVEAIVLLDQTPFYGESGGQTGDRGVIHCNHAKHEVIDTQKQEGLFLHRVMPAGEIAVGMECFAEVASDHRMPVIRNHSATHLLHNALRAELGMHVEQRGSLVAPGRLRFDFTHFEQIRRDQLLKIENQVNAMIRENYVVGTVETSLSEATAAGAMALFGEKYGDHVRMVSMGPSRELCGGTHCATTGEIGYFRIVSESSVAAGVRRIEALTGDSAVADARNDDLLLTKMAGVFKVRKENLFERLEALQEEKAELERKLEAAERKAAAGAAADLTRNISEVNGAKLLASVIPDADAEKLRSVLDSIRNQSKDCAVILGGAKDGKVALLASLPAELVSRGAHAGKLLQTLAAKVGGKGGGKPEMAQGGGSDPSQLAAAIASAPDLFAGMLK